MNRTVGVTVIAVLSLLGSILTLMMGMLMVVVMFLVPAHSPGQFPGSPAFFKIISLITSLMYVLPAIWGISSSIGLFRLKNWARISMIVFSVILVLMGGFGGLMSLVVPFPSTPNSPVDPSVMTGVRVFMVVFAFAQLGIGIWWLVFFNRAKVKQQFVRLPPALAGDLAPQTLYPRQAPSGAMAAAPSATERPLSITILAWFLLAGCLFIPLNLALHSPAVLFVKVLTGWPAALYFLAFGALNAYIGIGLLRLRPAARLVGIAYFVFGFVNAAAFYFAPGGHARMLALIDMQQSMFPWMRAWQNQPSLQFDLTPFLVIGTVAGLAVLTVPLYFLITRKQAFEKPAQQTSG